MPQQKQYDMFHRMGAKLAEIPRKPMRSVGPAFGTSLGALFHTDCLNLFASLADDSIDTVFADPPFNIGKDYGHGKDKDELDSNAYLTWCYRWMDEAVRVVKPGGAIFIYNLPQWAYHLAAHLERRDMTLRHWIAVSMKGTFPAEEALPRPLRAPVLHEGHAEYVQPGACACQSRGGTAGKTLRITEGTGRR